MDINLIIVAVYSYLLGSIPFGLVLTKIFLKKDIREIGSGNIGTTNVLRTGKKLLAVATLVLDLLKGYFSITLTFIYFENLISYSALICFIGHIFPVWLKFKGGKGVATYVGILFCINIYLGVIFIITWFIVFIISKYSSLASMIASLFVPLSSYFLFNDINYYFYIILFSLILITHRENIKRLKNNTESKTKIY